MVDEILAWLKIQDTPSNRSVIETLVDEARAAIEKEVDWYFGPPRETEELLGGNGGLVLFLRQPPVGGVVQIASRAGLSQPWVNVPTSSFDVAKRRVFHGSGWNCGYRNLRVRYQEGFEVIPGDVKALIKEMVATRWRSKGGAFLSETIGDYSYTRGDVTQHSTLWKTVVNNWKRGRI
jgi:hypothetical protein